MAYFIPADFDLYEFDDQGWADPLGRSARRWFSGFNGLIGASAEDVTLGWSDGEATVLVRTSGRRSWDEADARSMAAHVALGGDELPIAQRPESALDTFAEIDRITSATGFWSQTPDVLPGGPAADTIIWDRFNLAYIQLDSGAIFLAAIGIGLDQFKVRKVQNWDSYGVDATTSFPLSALRK
jgi:hypothetical protein